MLTTQNGLRYLIKLKGKIDDINNYIHTRNVRNVQFQMIFEIEAQSQESAKNHLSLLVITLSEDVIS